MSWRAMVKITRRYGPMLPVQAVRPSELTDHLRKGRRQCDSSEVRERRAETTFRRSAEHQARIRGHEERIARRNG